MFNRNGTPSDLNLILRGVLVAVAFAVLGLLVVANPAPWSALGQAERTPPAKTTPAPTPSAPSDTREA